MKHPILFVFLVFSGMSNAQTVQGGVNSWFFLFNQVQFNKRWEFSNELHERMGGFLKNQGHLLIRPSIDYHFDNAFVGSVGYTYIHSWPYDLYSLKIEKTENNIWEQVLLKYEVGKVQFQNRFRLEHRWSENVVGDGVLAHVDGVSYSNRFRFRWTGRRDFGLKNDRKLFALVFDELWINQNSRLAPTSFNRNWLYLGLGYAFNKNFNVQLGYMSQIDQAGSGFIYSPIVQTRLYYKINLIKST